VPESRGVRPNPPKIKREQSKTCHQVVIVVTLLLVFLCCFSFWCYARYTLILLDEVKYHGGVYEHCGADALNKQGANSDG